MSTIPPGWYQDPYGRAPLRWWDGTAWTNQCLDNGRQFQDALGPASTTPNAPAATPVTVPPVATPSVATSAARAGFSATIVALAAVVALLAGALVGYVLRGDGGGGGSSTGTTLDGGGDGTGSGSIAAPLLKSLADLNSFEFTLSMSTVGPTSADTSTTQMEGKRDAATESSYTKQTSSSTSADGDTNSSTTETWSVGDRSCTFEADNDPQYQTEARNPFELDIAGTLPGIFDVVVAGDNTQLVGTEQLAGVEVRHYTFTIDGLGRGSGDQVTANSGEIWVATDGGYVVKYMVKAGLRSAPEGTPGAEVFELTLTLELTSINQPVSITLPAQCPEPTPENGS